MYKGLLRHHRQILQGVSSNLPQWPNTRKLPPHPITPLPPSVRVPNSRHPALHVGGFPGLRRIPLWTPHPAPCPETGHSALVPPPPPSGQPDPARASMPPNPAARPLPCGILHYCRPSSAPGRRPPRCQPPWEQYLRRTHDPQIHISAPERRHNIGDGSWRSYRARPRSLSGPEPITLSLLRRARPWP